MFRNPVSEGNPAGASQRFRRFRHARRTMLASRHDAPRGRSASAVVSACARAAMTSGLVRPIVFPHQL